MNASLERRKVLEIKSDLESIKNKIINLEGIEVMKAGTIVMVDSLIDDMDDALIGLEDTIKLNQE